MNKQTTEEIIKLNPDLALLYRGPEASKVRELALAEREKRDERKRREREEKRAELREQLESAKNAVRVSKKASGSLADFG